MSTITKDQEQAIADYVNSHHLPSGLGTLEAACSIAAINIALTNTLTDTVPDCMSLVIGRWLISTQDTMSDAIRNSRAWKSLLPLAAGTGREHEQERLGIIINWMWCDVLPQVQRVADKGGYGQEWLTMRKLKTAHAARAAAHAADTAGAAGAAGAADAAGAAGAAAYAADAAHAAAYAAAYAVRAARAAHAALWVKCDPAKLLEKLIQAGATP